MFSSLKEVLKSKEFKKEAPKKVNLLIHKILRDAEPDGRKPRRAVKKDEKKKVA